MLQVWYMDSYFPFVLFAILFSAFLVQFIAPLACWDPKKARAVWPPLPFIATMLAITAASSFAGYWMIYKCGEQGYAAVTLAYHGSFGAAAWLILLFWWQDMYRARKLVGVLC